MSETGTETEAVTTEAPWNPWRQAKPNKMFPPEVQWLIRFYLAAKGEKLPPCPVCSKKTRGRWTMLCPFNAFSMGQFSLIGHPGDLEPLTLVCSDHLISPVERIKTAM